MLKANDDGQDPQLYQFSQTLRTDDQANDSGSLPLPSRAPCEETGRLIDLFEEITGWVIQFDESKSSRHRRKLVGMENESAEGTFTIIDMSTQWPAKKPTGHRSKCDDLVAIIDSLVGQLQATRNELNKMQSVVAAVSPETVEDEDIVLIDSFVPTKGQRRTDAEFEVCDAPVASGDDEFETKFDEPKSQPTPGAVVNPPFEGWTLGGATGINENVYLDWRVDTQEQIELSVGRIESRYGDGDAAAFIQVDPLTCEYRLFGSMEINGFFVWDSKSMSLTPLKIGGTHRRLLAGQALVATTSSKLIDMDFKGSRDEDRIDHPENQTSKDSLANADSTQLAACVARHIGPDDRVLVLKHR